MRATRKRTAPTAKAKVAKVVKKPSAKKKAAVATTTFTVTEQGKVPRDELENFFQSCAGCTLCRTQSGTKVYYGKFNVTPKNKYQHLVYLRQGGDVWVRAAQSHCPRARATHLVLCAPPVHSTHRHRETRFRDRCCSSLAAARVACACSFIASSRIGW